MFHFEKNGKNADLYHFKVLAQCELWRGVGISFKTSSTTERVSFPASVFVEICQNVVRPRSVERPSHLNLHASQLHVGHISMKE